MIEFEEFIVDSGIAKPETDSNHHIYDKTIRETDSDEIRDNEDMR